MTLELEQLRSLLDRAFALMGTDPIVTGPRPLDRMLRNAIDAEYGEPRPEVALAIRRSMLDSDPNNPVRGKFGQMLRQWDFASGNSWAQDTGANTVDRRALVYELLGLDVGERAATNEHVPVADMRNRTIVIAPDHEEWYRGRRRQPGFYWVSLTRHFKASHWSQESIDDLDESSGLIIERLSDPTAVKQWKTKGLVIGYVQSGKTANFTAVVAKAVDAGYRLIIILGGVLDVLRNQTQRRIDQDLVGQELIRHGVPAGMQHEYAHDTEFRTFIRHGDLPSRQGSFDLYRLTDSRNDYRSVGLATDALEFKGFHDDRAFNHADNLHRHPARIVIVKKNAAVLKRLTKDLGRLRHTDLNDVPALVIDDESDQASINTTSRKKDPDTKKRTSTNDAIIQLLDKLPRSQYVGYTATPFANVFVNPNDAVDLFPKDFLIGLKRPPGYMGVRDFFDFDEDGRPLEGNSRPPGFGSNERAFLRDVRLQKGERDQIEKDRRCLAEALDAFILGGAIKLFRIARGIEVAKKRHHTMLVHLSTRTAEHAKIKNLLSELYNKAEYGSRAAEARLMSLWLRDQRPVSEVRAPELPSPGAFEELLPYIEATLQRIHDFGGAVGPVRVVNAEPGSREDTPEFDRESVWGVLIGGAKLSRGFTVEGLTISYFRRPVKTADTLMQTGRWFGFRHGYADLVRVYVGRDEPDGRSGTFDLMRAFKAICQDEEMFRAELARYAPRSDGGRRITPREVPPLVAEHLLPPTARNKMQNVLMEYQNLGGEQRESTFIPPDEDSRAETAVRTRALLERLTFRKVRLGATVSISNREASYEWDGRVAELSPEDGREVLRTLRSRLDPRAYDADMTYLRAPGGRDPGVRRWLLIVPEVTTTRWWTAGERFPTVVRERIDASRVGAFSEPRHRRIASVLAALSIARDHTSDLKGLMEEGTAVMLLYPTVPSDSIKGEVQDKELALGLSLVYPRNAIPQLVVFRVTDGNVTHQVAV